jgi:serine/threonine protein phosphatase PrpC
MTLRVTEQAHLSDTGRQRTANEDSFFAAGDVYAVADGMGGAQAGEVASKIAAESIVPDERGDASPEAFLRSVAEDANRRIHALSEEDSSRSGMGTTFTAALVEGDEVSLGHVGDSRAYVFREGELRLLTSDHSLVEELRRQGRLTPEQAEDHPQRSIITRALGPEPEVEVDTMTFSARPGDVYLLCSDGLTTMVKDEQITEILASAATLDEAARQLVEAANAAGGRDNVTVVAFRVDDEGAPVTDDADATLVGPSAAGAGLSGPELREAAARAPSRERARRRTEPAPKRSRGRRVAMALFTLVLVAGVIAAGWYGLRQVYFLGADEGGRIALFRGLPYDLPLGIDLYSEVYSVPVQVDSLPQDRRSSVTDHELRSRDDAVSLLNDLQDEVREPQPQPEPAKDANRKRGGGQNDGGGQGGQAGGGGGGQGDRQGQRQRNE